MTKLAISNDTGDCITTKLLNVLSETEEPALQDLVNILEHLSVDSQQFAKIIKALPTEEYLWEDFIRAIIHVTDPFDILALKRALRSENVQRLFLQYFRQEEILTDINSAWSTFVSKRSDRHEGWYRGNASLILDLLHSMDYPLPKVICTLTFEYLGINVYA